MVGSISNDLSDAKITFTPLPKFDDSELIFIKVEGKKVVTNGTTSQAFLCLWVW